MKKSTRVFHDLETVVEHTFAKLLNTIIIKVGEQYVVYNKYSITRTESHVVVFRRQDHVSVEFNKMKHAMMWITLDHHVRLAERDRIQRLDSDLTSIEVEKKIHERLKKKYQDNLDMFLIYKTKIDADRRKEKRIIAEIDKYYKMANTISHIQGNKK
jgi:hypothetical protein